MENTTISQNMQIYVHLEKGLNYSCGQEVGEENQASANPRSSLRLANQGEGYERSDCYILQQSKTCSKNRYQRKVTFVCRVTSWSFNKKGEFTQRQPKNCNNYDGRLNRKWGEVPQNMLPWLRTSKVVKDYQTNEEEPFDGVKNILFDSPDVIEYAALTKTHEDNLKGLEGVDNKYAKKNVRRKIENLLNVFNFITVNNSLFVN